MIISIPYPDKDNDSIVDGTNINAETLDIYTYNETTQEWEKLPETVVYLDEHYVEAKTSHFSIFDLGGKSGSVISGGNNGASSNGSGVSGCFIATASFGTPFAKEVRMLSEFRDRYLLTNPAGRAFVRFYYRHSPPIADYIRDKEHIKKIVRMLLQPFVKVSKILCRHEIH